MPDRATMDEQKMLDRQRKAIESAIRWLDLHLSEEDNMGWKLQSVSISGPNKTGGEFRVVVKATDEQNKPFYAITSGAELAGTLRQLQQTAEGKGLNLKPDTPYKPGG